MPTTLLLTATDALSDRGGCEFPDPGCVPSDEQERVLQVLEQAPQGELSRRGDLAWPLPGRPMWSTSSTLPDGMRMRARGMATHTLATRMENHDLSAKLRQMVSGALARHSDPLCNEPQPPRQPRSESFRKARCPSERLPRQARRMRSRLCRSRAAPNQKGRVA